MSEVRNAAFERVVRDSFAAQRLMATGWREIYAYFMHEPTAPAYAQLLMNAARA